jgi:hypothetical protein
VQRKRINEKITRKKKTFHLTKCVFILFFILFGPLLFSNLIIFLFCIHIKRLKVLYECHLKFYKLSLNSNSNRATYEEFFGCLKTSLCSLQWFFLFEFWTPFSLGGYNFLISNPFLTIASVSDASREGVQVLFWHQKHTSPPLGSGLPWALKCSVTGRSTLTSI